MSEQVASSKVVNHHLASTFCWSATNFEGDEKFQRTELLLFLDSRHSPNQFFLIASASIRDPGKQKKFRPPAKNRPDELRCRDYGPEHNTSTLEMLQLARVKE